MTRARNGQGDGISERPGADFVTEPELGCRLGQTVEVFIETKDTHRFGFAYIAASSDHGLEEPHTRKQPSIKGRDTGLSTRHELALNEYELFSHCTSVRG